METTLISKCCRAEVTEHLVGDEMAYQCDACEMQCEVERVCAECLGEGTVTTMEAVYPGEPHMAPIGTKVCICRSKLEHQDD